MTKEIQGHEVFIVTNGEHIRKSAVDGSLAIFEEIDAAKKIMLKSENDAIRECVVIRKDRLINLVKEIEQLKAKNNRLLSMSLKPSVCNEDHVKELMESQDDES